MQLILEPTRLAADVYAHVLPSIKTAGARLVSPPAYWDDEITQILLREHPYIPVDRATVTFKQKDDTTGSAIGFISIIGSPRISIPVIVKNWELSPMDIIIVQRSEGTADSDAQTGSADANSVLPLNEDTFSQSLDTGSIGEPLPMHHQVHAGFSEDGSSLRIPFQGRTVIASVVGASDDQKAKLASALDACHEDLVGFVCNGTGSVVDEWLAAPAPSMTLATKMASAQVKVSHADVARTESAFQDLSDYSVVGVLNGDLGVDMATKVATVDLVTGKTSSLLLFMDGSYSSAPSSILGIPAPEDVAAEVMRATLEKTAATTLSKGQTISLFADGVFTAPRKIASIAIDEGTQAVTLTVSNAAGTLERYVVDNRVKQAMQADGSWIFPGSTTVLALGAYVSEPVADKSKVASKLASAYPDTLIVADGQWSVSVGNEAKASGVSKSKIASLLGLYLDNADELMSAAEERGFVRFASGIKDTAAEVEQKIAAFQAMPAECAKHISDVVLPLDVAVKIAARIGDPAGVDAVLGAGMLTEDNIAEFVGLSDQFEQTVGRLARLLLAIRLGLPGDESATVVAMKALSRVAERLRSAGIEGNVGVG